jgi:hypothetical protein
MQSLFIFYKAVSIFIHCSNVNLEVDEKITLKKSPGGEILSPRAPGGNLSTSSLVTSLIRQTGLSKLIT